MPTATKKKKNPKTSVMDTCILSLDAIDLVYLFNEVLDTILTFGAESMKDYKGPLVLHCLPRQDALPPNAPAEAVQAVEETRKIETEMIEGFGETWDNYPGSAILGIARMELIEYISEEQFRKDQPRHLEEVTLDFLRQEGGFDPHEPVFGLRLSKVDQLTEPVFDVFASEEVMEAGSGAIWLPRTPLELQACKMALRAKLMTPEEVEADEEE